MHEWKRYEVTIIVEAHRRGWRGAFDAVVSAITGRPRLAVPRNVVASAYSDKPVHLSLFQVEESDEVVRGTGKG